MESVIELLKRIKPSAEIKDNTNLIDECIIDSLSMIVFVNELCNEFDVEITAKDITPENFATPSTIYNLISRIENEDD